MFVKLNAFTEASSEFEVNCEIIYETKINFHWIRGDEDKTDYNHKYYYNEETDSMFRI